MMVVNIKWNLFNSPKFYLVIATALCLMIWYLVYQRILYVREQRRHFIYEFYDENLYNFTYIDMAEQIIQEKQETVRAILHMKTKIKNINTRQKVHNKYAFNSRVKKVVIVIQVHKTLEYFRELINSLRNIIGIQNTLIIFSHDYYDEAINRLIKSITFVRYLQIFYPFSVQLHPKMFPGPDKTFCKDDFQCEPSSQRDYDAAQSKNFWWWQITHVFDHMDIIENYNGPVIFLEEDNYVTADFMYVLKILQNFKARDYFFSGIISLGATTPFFEAYNSTEAVFVRKPFNDDGDTIGIVFDRRLWNAIKAKASHFCYFDDYKWDNSLRNVAANISNHFYVYTIQGPRVFRFDKCNEDAFSCKMKYKVEEVKDFVNIIQDHLFPSKVLLKIGIDLKLNITPSTLFNDVRDRELCMYFTNHEVWF